MTYEDNLLQAETALDKAYKLIQDEIRNYPTPISGCDAQYNHLIGMRGSIREARTVIKSPRFVATPRAPQPFAGVESR